MAEYHLRSEWKSGLAFDTTVNKHTVRLDSGEEGFDSGPSPKRMVLAGLMACTGMDVVGMMKKMRVPFTAFRIEGIAPITADHPKVFESVHLIYRVEGEGIKRSKVEKAIELSQEKYCGVSVMLKKHCPVTWELILE